MRARERGVCTVVKAAEERIEWHEPTSWHWWQMSRLGVGECGHVHNYTDISTQDISLLYAARVKQLRLLVVHRTTCRTAILPRARRPGHRQALQCCCSLTIVYVIDTVPSDEIDVCICAARQLASPACWRSRTVDADR